MEKRQIGQDVYNRVIKNIPEIIIKMLPDNPKELLKYAKRVKQIRFSDNVSEEVKVLMQKFLLSDEEYLKTFYYVMAITFYNKISVKKPKMHIVTAQTGSGKSNLTAKILRDDESCIFIDSDKYKHFRFDAQEIANNYQVLYPFLTGPDAYDHADNIYQYALKHKYNLIKEVAPSKSKGFIGKELEDIQSNNYELSMHILAVGELNSALSVHERYEMQIIHGLKTAKLTDLKRHNESYEALEKNVLDIQKDIDISVYTRGAKENNFEPIEIYSNNKYNDDNEINLQKYKEVVKKIQEERKKDNANTLKEFDNRYKLVVKQMERRKSPKEQIEQLNKIYEMSKIKH